MEQDSQTINPRRFLSLLSHLTSEHWLFICFIYIAPFMSFHQQVCLYGKLMASQSCSLKACVSVCVCLFVCIHPYILCWYIHPWICICVCVWVGGCLCVFYPLSSERKSTFSWSSTFFFFYIQYNLPSLFSFHFSFPPHFSLSFSPPPPHTHTHTLPVCLNFS